MKRIGLVITDGVGFRNFILSDFLDKALKQGDLVIIFSCIPKENYEIVKGKCKVIELEVFQESSITWLFRKTKELTHLQNHRKNNFGIQDNIKITKSTSKSTRGKIVRFLHKFTKVFHSERLVNFYYFLQEKSFQNNLHVKNYKNILTRYRVDVLLFTHQRPPYIAPIIYAAKKRKIVTATFIFSWDNIASKGRMAGDFDHYLVWSNLMRDELLQFYSKIKSKSIHVIGTPQFSPFVMKTYGYTKEKLCEKFCLDIEKPIIFFTCNDASSKNDPLYLEILAKAIEEKKIHEAVNLIVRTSIADDGKTFEHLRKYKFIKWNNPKWELTRINHQEPWSQRVPDKEDIDDLKSLLNHCTLNINILSTITLDAFIFNKPVINPVFGNENNELFNDQKFLKYKHIKLLVDSKSSSIVKNKIDYIEEVNNLLDGKEIREKARDSFLDLEILRPLEKTSDRIVKALKELA